MFGPYELDILLFLELQAKVEASSVNLGQAFINKYASFRVGFVMRAQPMSLAEYSVSGLPGAERRNHRRPQKFFQGGNVDILLIPAWFNPLPACGPVECFVRPS